MRFLFFSLLQTRICFCFGSTAVCKIYCVKKLNIIYFALLSYMTIGGRYCLICLQNLLVVPTERMIAADKKHR